MDNLTHRPPSYPIHGWTPLGPGDGSSDFSNFSLYDAPLLHDSAYFQPLTRNIYVLKKLGQLQYVNAYIGRSPQATVQLIGHGIDAVTRLREDSSLTSYADESSEMADDVAPWFTRAFERLQELMLLPPDWDGEQGRAVTPDVASATFKLLDRLASRTTLEPSLVPTREGRLQLEWHEPTGHLEAEVDGDGSVHIWFLDLLSNQEREDTARSVRAAIGEIDALVTVLEIRE